MEKADLRHYKKFLYRDDENSPVLLSLCASIMQNGNNLYEFYTWRKDIAEAVGLLGLEVSRSTDAYGKQWGYDTEYPGKIFIFSFTRHKLPEILKVGQFTRNSVSPKSDEYPTFYFPDTKRHFIFAWNIEEILGVKLKANGQTLSELWQKRRELEQKDREEAFERLKLEQFEQAKFKGLLHLQFELEDLLQDEIKPFIQIDTNKLELYYQERLQVYPACEQVEYCKKLLGLCIERIKQNEFTDINSLAGD